MKGSESETQKKTKKGRFWQLLKREKGFRIQRLLHGVAGG